jgi:hypothetical protein
VFALMMLSMGGGLLGWFASSMRGTRSFIDRWLVVAVIFIGVQIVGLFATARTITDFEPVSTRLLTLAFTEHISIASLFFIAITIGFIYWTITTIAEDSGEQMYLRLKPWADGLCMSTTVILIAGLLLWNVSLHTMITRWQQGLLLLI